MFFSLLNRLESAILIVRPHHAGAGVVVRMFRVPTSLLLILAFTAPALCAGAPAAVTGASVGTQPRDLVYNAAAMRNFIDAAAARRVDITGIGDSNQIAGPNSTYGWDH